MVGKATRIVFEKGWESHQKSCVRERVGRPQESCSRVAGGLPQESVMFESRWEWHYKSRVRKWVEGHRICVREWEGGLYCTYSKSYVQNVQFSGVSNSLSVVHDGRVGG